MLGVLLKAYMRQAAAEKEAGLVLGHSRGLLTWSNKFLEASSQVSTVGIAGSLTLKNNLSPDEYALLAPARCPALHTL